MKHRHAVRPKEPDDHIGQALAVRLRAAALRRFPMGFVPFWVSKPPHGVSGRGGLRFGW